MLFLKREKIKKVFNYTALMEGRHMINMKLPEI